MSNHAALKLVKPTPAGRRDAIPLERRGARRYTLTDRVTSLQTNNDPTDQRNRICSLQLRNISDSGLGAISPEPIEPNTRIAVFFPPHGPEQGFDRYGHVVRCTDRECGHEIGIRFDTRHAA